MLAELIYTASSSNSFILKYMLALCYLFKQKAVMFLVSNVANHQGL